MRLALFDLDGTLIEKDSDHAFGEFMVACGWADADVYRAANDGFHRQYLAGCLDIHAYIDFATRPWRDRSAAEQQRAIEQFMHEVMRPILRDDAKHLVRRHLQAGDQVAIVTATNEFITRPIAEAFGVSTLIATELQRDDEQRVTGRIRGIPSFQAGKVARVERWLASQGGSLRGCESSVFYSDSTNDLALLEAVSDPVATNPTPELEAVARGRGWRILRIFG